MLFGLTHDERSRAPWAALAAGAVVAVIGIALASWLGHGESRRYRSNMEAGVRQQLSTVRAAIESALNERIYLTLGLRAYVSSNPELTSDQFARFAASLMEEGAGIRSATLIKDNVINDVYPLAGNESAIGTRLLELPAQRKDVLRAIESREPWLTAPVRLVQGGEAFINRAPVYETPSGQPPGSGRYWGLVSTLIGKDVLLDDIVRGLPDNLKLGIRSKAVDENGGEYILGNELIEAENPITLDIRLPTGDWKVSGVPTNGWPKRAPAALVLQWLGTCVSIGMGVLTFMLLRSNQNYLASRMVAEQAVVELSHKNEDLEAFVRSASHDLRSPLRHIKSFSQLLAEDADDRLNDEDRTYISRISSSIERMMQLLDSLLRFAKTGTKALKPEIFSLHRTVEDVTSLLPVPQQNRVHYSGLSEVYGDRTLLTQVLQNLIENGLKYHDGDEAQVHIQNSTDGAQTIISVSDNGIGMDANQLQRIFKAGVRGVGPSEYPGSGFGLAICDRIVKAHGGSIRAESTLGEGSTFHVILPAAPNGQSPTAG